MFFLTLILEIELSISDGVVTATGSGQITQEIMKKVNSALVKQVITTQGVTGIGENSFLLFLRLKSLHLSSTISTFIGSALRSCSYFENLTLDESNPYFVLDDYGCLLSNDKENLYYVNRNLKSYVIPETVKALHTHAFHGCNFLSTLIIPSNIESIQTSSFDTFRVITIEFAIDSQIEVLNPNIFPYCTMRNIFIPRSVKKIMKESFRRVNYLENITFAEDSQLELIEPLAITYSQIKIITIPRFTNISKDAFNPASKLETIYLNSNNITLNIGCFNGCPQLTFINITNNDNLKYENNILTDKDYIICYFVNPSLTSVEFMKDMILSEQLIQTVPHLTSVSFETGSKYISEDGIVYTDSYTQVFAAAGGLVEAILRREVRIICDYCFSNLAKIKRIIIQSDLNSIGKYAFASCSVSELHFKSVIRVYDYCFSQCSATNITFTYGPEYIHDYAFTTCQLPNFTFNGAKALNQLGLSYSTISQATFLETCSLTSIGWQVFLECRSLESVTFCSSITYIASRCFHLCNKLKYIYFPTNSSLNKIDSQAFFYCPIVSIVLPSNLRTLEKGVFEQCKSLQSVIFESENVNIISGAFTGCSSLESVTFNSVSYIQSDIFTDCDSLNYITIRNQDSELISYNGSVYTNQDKILLFVCNGATELYIYDKITSIDSDAFSSCIKLKFISFPSNCSSLFLVDDSILSKINKLEEIIFPSYFSIINFVGFQNYESIKKVTINAGAYNTFYPV